MDHGLKEKRGKSYKRKPISGILDGTLSYKCGKACLIIPEEKIELVKAEIVKSGGEVRINSSCCFDY